MEYSIRAFFLEFAAGWSMIRGNRQRAMLRYEKLLAITEKRFGKDHFKNAHILFELAGCYHYSGDADSFRASLPLYHRALIIATNSNDLLKDHFVGKTACRLGDCYAAMSSDSAAASKYKDSIDAFSRYQGQHSKFLLEPLYGRAKALRALGQKEEAEQLEKWAKFIEDANADVYYYEHNRHYPRF